MNLTKPEGRKKKDRHQKRMQMKLHSMQTKRADETDLGYYSCVKSCHRGVRTRDLKTAERRHWCHDAPFII